jgi:2-amino-4-hydroxy-6-hydroxymethyldihydropteridine diphosphokinase
LGRRVRAYIGLGSNVGDREANIDRALAAIAGEPGVHLRAISSLYQTKPVGGVDQPDFLNAVVAVDVPVGPEPQTAALSLLAALKEIEQSIGRQPRRRWGPREIDLDLLVFGRHRIDVDPPDGRWLKVPHPEMANRLFVLTPLADLVPNLRPPGWSASVAAARDRRLQIEGSNAVRRVDR